MTDLSKLVDEGLEIINSPLLDASEREYLLDKFRRAHLRTLLLALRDRDAKFTALRDEWRAKARVTERDWYNSSGAYDEAADRIDSILKGGAQ